MNYLKLNNHMIIYSIFQKSLLKKPDFGTKSGSKIKNQLVWLTN
jgi:hypothetical protein